jgi:hypothetical protein
MATFTWIYLHLVTFYLHHFLPQGGVEGASIGYNWLKQPESGDWLRIHPPSPGSWRGLDSLGVAWDVLANFTLNESNYNEGVKSRPKQKRRNDRPQ